MPDWLAWFIYFSGFLGTLTSPIDDVRLATRRDLWLTLLVALAWPLMSLFVVAGRLARLVRRG